MQRFSLFLVFVGSLLLGPSHAHASSSPDAPKPFHQNMEQRREVIEGIAPVVRHLIHGMDSFIAELKEFREYKASRRHQHSQPHHPLDGHPAGASLHRAAPNDDMEEGLTLSKQPHVAQNDHSSRDTHSNLHRNLLRDHDAPSDSSMTDTQWLQDMLGDSISDEQMKRLTKMLGQFVADNLHGSTKRKHGHKHRPHIETGSIKCTLCETMMAGIKPFLTSKVALDIIQPIAIVVCEAMQPQCKGKDNCKDLCTGVVGEFAAEVLEIVADSILSPPNLCYMLKACDAPTPAPPLPYEVPVPSNLTDHSGEKPWPSWKLKNDTGYFIQLSDIHIDLKYVIGTNSDCGQPLCCRAKNGPGNNDTAAGFWGDYNCDSPPQLVESLFYHISKLDPQPDFILYTGDDPPHDIWEQSREGNALAIRTLSEMMQKHLPEVPVFSAVGNHESFPVNQFRGPGFDSWLYDELIKDWSYWLCDDALKTLEYAGYYTSRVRPGLRVVSLNTNLWMSGDNFWLTVNNTDIAHQADWLEDVLKQAEALHEKVIIIGHAASQDWGDDFSWRFAHLVEQYQSTIVNQFYGHTHYASFQMWFDNATGTVPINVGFIAGSVTPYTQLNPGFRMYYYDRAALEAATAFPSSSSPATAERHASSHRHRSPGANQFKKIHEKVKKRTASEESQHAAEEYHLVLDYRGFWLDLSTTNKENRTDWATNTYLATEMYNLTSPLTPEEMAKLGHRLLVENDVYERFMHNYYRGYPVTDPDTPLSISCNVLTYVGALFRKCAAAAGFPHLKRPPSKC